MVQQELARVESRTGKHWGAPLNYARNQPEDYIVGLPAQPLETLEAARPCTDRAWHLLAFASKQTVAAEVLDLNEMVANSLLVLQRLIGEDGQLSWLPEMDLWSIWMDPSQLRELLTTLCIHARDAIAQGGQITLATANRVVHAEDCANKADALPGEYVRLSLSDDGRGMGRETRTEVGRVFWAGHATGLATIDGNVRLNHGFIMVFSPPDGGTAFDIYLPRYRGGVELVKAFEAQQPARQGQETILLVEDEPTILKLTARMLEARGYTVLSASGPSQAIQLAREHGPKLHLLVTDVVMPEMNGRDLANTLVSLCPHLKRLFMSGYTAGIMAHPGLVEEGVFFVQKPFSLDGLVAKVRQALDFVGD